MNYQTIDDNDLIKVTQINSNGSKAEDYPFTEFKRMLLNTDDNNLWWKKKFISATEMQVGSKQESTAPTFAVFNADATRTSDYSGLLGIKFLGNTADIWQDAYFNFQLQNDYKADTPLVPKMFLYLDNPTIGQKLLLEFEFSWFDAAVAAPTITTFNHTIVSSTAHMAVVTLPSITVTNMGLGSLLCCRVSRINKATGWTYPNLTGLSDDNAVTDAYLLGVSFDYKADAVGANSQTAKTFGAPRIELL